MTRFKEWIAVLLCAVALSLPLWLLHHSGDAGFGPVAFLFTGRALADRPIVTGGALDQFSLHKEFFILCYSHVVLCPFLALVRWLSRTVRSPLGFVLVGASLVTLAHPFSVLTIFSWDVARYVCRMGVTPMRLVGLMVALVAYGAIGVFAMWLVGIRMKKPNQASHATSEPAPGAASSAREG
jgi:hypothetical protein